MALIDKDRSFVEAWPSGDEIASRSIAGSEPHA
jgi:hypothetical protein